MSQAAAQTVYCDSVAELLGIHCVRDEHGLTLATIETRAEHSNIHGIVHGVVLFALADIGMGFALDRYLHSRKIIATISITSTFIRPAQCGMLVSETELINCGKTVATLRTNVRDASNKRCALFTGSFHIAGNKHD